MEYLLTILPRANNFLLIEDLVVLISDEHASAGTAGVLACCSPLMLLTRAWQPGTPAVPATAFQISTRYFSETTFQESSLALISNQLERSLELFAASVLAPVRLNRSARAACNK